MLVKQVLEFGDLGVTPLWAPPRALERAVTGVNTADMENPATYLSPGEIVLTGLLWWHPHRPGSARTFVSAARAAGTVALIAGEGMHGRVPGELVEECRAHDLPLFSVPRSTTFRAIVDRIYFLLWADLRDSPGAAVLPSTIEQELLERITAADPLDDILGTAAERLDLPGLAMVSATGRVIASSGPPPNADPARQTRVPVGPGGRSPFDGWWLRAGQPVSTAQRPVLDQLAALLSASAKQRQERLAAHAAAATAMLADLERGDATAIPDMVRRCGLDTNADLTPLVVRTPEASSIWAVDAANELLAGCTTEFAVCEAGAGEAVGITTTPPEQLAPRVSEYLPIVQELVGDEPAIAVGLGPSTDPRDLISAATSARYAAAAAERRPASTMPRMCAVSDMTSLDTLLGGLPAPVIRAFTSGTIGPITRYDAVKGTQLLETLKIFLDSGASWTRTAAAMHLHVNTVHYRIERVEALTGRRMADAHDRNDLHTALVLHQQSNPALDVAD